MGSVIPEPLGPCDECCAKLPDFLTARAIYDYGGTQFVAEGTINRMPDNPCGFEGILDGGPYPLHFSAGFCSGDDKLLIMGTTEFYDCDTGMNDCVGIGTCSPWPHWITYWLV